MGKDRPFELKGIHANGASATNSADADRYQYPHNSTLNLRQSTMELSKLLQATKPKRGVIIEGARPLGSTYHSG